MLILSIISVISDVILLAFLPLSLLFGLEEGIVTELPYVQTQVDFFSSTLHGLFNILPILTPMWQVFISALSIKLVMIAYARFMELLKLIRG